MEHSENEQPEAAAQEDRQGASMRKVKKTIPAPYSIPKMPIIFSANRMGCSLL